MSRLCPVLQVGFRSFATGQFGAQALETQLHLIIEEAQRPHPDQERPRGPHANRVSAEIEAAVLDHALAYPCHGAARVEQELRLKGLRSPPAACAGCGSAC